MKLASTRTHSVRQPRPFSNQNPSLQTAVRPTPRMLLLTLLERSRRPPRSKPNRLPPTSITCASLRPLGQLRESFILATGTDGLWIIDQHVAHERVLFEKILRDRQVEHVQRQRLLMPFLVELKPWQMVVFAQIAEELDRNGFEVEPFGPQTLAVKAAPVGLEGPALERMLAEVIEQSGGDSRGTRAKSGSYCTSHTYSSFHRLPLRHQNQHPARSGAHGVAVDRTFKD